MAVINTFCRFGSGFGVDRKGIVEGDQRRGRDLFDIEAFHQDFQGIIDLGDFIVGKLLEFSRQALMQELGGLVQQFGALGSQGDALCLDS